MKIGLYTEALRALPFEEMLDVAAGCGVETLEIATGGQSTAPHLPLDRLLQEPETRTRWVGAIQQRGLELESLNCSAFPLHPRLGPAQVELTRKSIRLAALLGLDTLVTQSGCPGDSEQARLPNWIVSRWPAENVEVLEWQWERTISLWRDLAGYAADHGIRRLCFELHPMNMVYNVPTLLRLREAAGPLIGVNLDPSHLLWQGMDVLACIKALGTAISHVHLKDTYLDPQALALGGVLDTTAPRTLAERAWSFRPVGHGHDRGWWQRFVDTLRLVGYDGVLSIENEHELYPGVDGVRRAVAFAREVI